MTLVMVVQAADGLVLASDGRTSVFDVPVGELGNLVPDCDDACKLVAVSGTSIAALLVGKARFNDGKHLRTVAEVCIDFLNEEFGSGQGVPPDDITVERVARVLKNRFALLVHKYNLTEEDDVTGIVAGYSAGEHEDTHLAEVWRFSARRPGAPEICSQFSDHGLCLEPRGPAAYWMEKLSAIPTTTPKDCIAKQTIVPDRSWSAWP